MAAGGSSSEEIKKGPWKAEEDEVLLQHVRQHGPRHWSSIRSKGLLHRTGKSCRLRWVNKLRPDLKSGLKFSAEEERIVIDLQAHFGNKWAKIATYLPGRTDNDVKNFWSSRRKRFARIINSTPKSSTAAGPLNSTPHKKEEEAAAMMKLRSCDHEEYSCSCEWTSIPMLEDSTNPAAWFPFEPPPDHFGLETAPCSCCGAGFSGWPPQVHTPLQRLENDQVAAAAACFNTTLGGDGDDLAFLDALGNAPPAADQSFMCCSSAAAAGISNDNYFYCGDSVLIPDPSSFVDGDFPIDYDVFDDQLPNPPPAADS